MLLMSGSIRQSQSTNPSALHLGIDCMNALLKHYTKGSCLTKLEVQMTARKQSWRVCAPILIYSILTYEIFGLLSAIFGKEPISH